ncbi:MAG: DUF6788 family protein [Halobacteriota archaeon]|jgi:hypothetical protein
MMTDDHGGSTEALGDAIGAGIEIDSVRRLLHQSNELINNIAALTDKRAVLNPLPGSLRKRHLRCGKRSCRCRSGALHGPYYYFEPSRQHGKWRYVPKERLSEVRQGIADWKKQREIDEMLQACAAQLDAALKALRQEVELLVQPAE